MFGAIAEGTTELTGFLDGADCRSTIDCFRRMGIEILQEESHVVVHGKGLYGLSSPHPEVPLPLDTGNSGTTTRIISGILAGQSFPTRLCGDASLNSRPMGRIMAPLTEMGASVASEHNDGCAPLLISPAKLRPIEYLSPVASAQVKSCVLLAGLYAEGVTTVAETALSRNHTELMLSGFGAKITSQVSGLSHRFRASIEGHPTLQGQKITVPGDISSAAYFIAAGLIADHGELLIRNVSCNPTRAGIIEVAKAMGGNVELKNRRIVSGEEVCDVYVRGSNLRGVTIEGDTIPTLIDEIPAIAIMAAYADGETVIKDAAELKVKESDRILAITENLRSMGGNITPTADGMIIKGGRPLHGGLIRTHMDHRIAMAFSIASLMAEGVTTLDHPECVEISYPSFFATFEKCTE